MHRFPNVFRGGGGGSHSRVFLPSPGVSVVQGKAHLPTSTSLSYIELVLRFTLNKTS